MLIYLLKATLAWSASLLLFEALLRKLPTHRANRAYLLMTLAAGFILPLVSLQTSEDASSASPVYRIFSHLPAASASAPMPVTTAPPQASTPTFSATDWVWTIWLAGVAVSTLLLILQAFRLGILNRRGIKTRESELTIVETGAPHGPFSFFHRVFVGRRADYSPGEWRMVLAHEGCHVRRWHSLDVLLLTVLKAVLWFHPVIYWYSRRLRLVHEYEADAAASTTPSVYGRFLLEQTALAGVPALALAFFHSPTKSRITMLLRHQSSTQRSAYLAVLPLLSVLLLCCTREQPASQVAANDETAQTEGNVFEMSKMVQLPVLFQSGDVPGDSSFMTIRPKPVKMNGEPIYESADLTVEPQYAGRETGVTTDIFNRVKHLMEKLEDGGYILNIPSIIVDKTGKVVYQDEGDFFSSIDNLKVAGDESEFNNAQFSFKNGYATLRLPDCDGRKPDISDDLRRKILAAMHSAIAKDIRFSPGEVDGKPVLAYVGSAVQVDDRLSFPTFGLVVKVEKGKAQLVEFPN